MRNILCIDIKSFFASVECAERGLDPFTTPLVVTDASRGNGATTLAVTPYLKSLGVESRCKIYELPKNINILYIFPRMKLYELYSHRIVDIFKKFIDEKDILVFSIDESFLDVTDYLNYYKLSDYDLALKIMNTLQKELKLYSTCGIGPNMFLAKVAMDTEAKKSKNFISKWTYDDVETKLQNITPLSKIVGIGRKYEKHLNDLGIHKLKDIFKYPKEFYIRRFGLVAGESIWCKASGIDYTSIQEENKRIKEKSMSLSQVLVRDYYKDEAFLIIIEMTDMLCRKLRLSKKQTSKITLFVNYSREYDKHFSKSINIYPTDNQDDIIKYFKTMFYDNIEDLQIRKVGIIFNNLTSKYAYQYSIFENNDKSNNYNKTLDNLYDKYGPNTILRASSLLNYSTIKKREKLKNSF